MPTIHAFDYLQSPADHPPAAVNVLFGDDPFLRKLVLKQMQAQLATGDDASVTTFNAEAPWRDVADELATTSLFGGGKRIVLIEDDDKFVSTHRQKLEDYVAKPKSASVLLLAVDTWASNTKLYKAVDASGLQVTCSVPSRQAGNQKEIDVPRISKWLIAWAKSEHQIILERTAADQLVEIVGAQLGVIDRDLAKLALYTKPGETVTVDRVKDVIGGWRMRTIWQLMDDVADGKAVAALTELDHLFRSDMEPQAVFGGISWAMRRYAAATRIVQRQKRLKQPINLGAAAKEAGFRPFGDELQKAERQLKQIGSARAGKLLQWLLEIDLSLKGSHSTKQRGRLAIEMLFLRLAKETAPPKPAVATRV